MTSQDERKKPGEADRDDDGRPAKTQSDLRKDGKERRQEPPAGEDITGEGSPGLTITGGSGHA